MHLPHVFDPTQIAPAGAPSQSLPVSDSKGHLVYIHEIEPVSLKSGNGTGLHFHVTIAEGPYKGKTGKHRLNIGHDDPETTRIAYAQLSALMYVTGHMTPGQDLTPMIGTPFRVVVVLQDGEEAQQKGWTNITHVLDHMGNEPLKATPATTKINIGGTNSGFGGPTDFNPASFPTEVANQAATPPATMPATMPPGPAPTPQHNVQVGQPQMDVGTPSPTAEQSAWEVAPTPNPSPQQQQFVPATGNQADYQHGVTGATVNAMANTRQTQQQHPQPPQVQQQVEVAPPQTQALPQPTGKKPWDR